MATYSFIFWGGGCDGSMPFVLQSPTHHPLRPNPKTLSPPERGGGGCVALGGGRRAQQSAWDCPKLFSRPGIPHPIVLHELGRRGEEGRERERGGSVSLIFQPAAVLSAENSTLVGLIDESTIFITFNGRFNHSNLPTPKTCKRSADYPLFLLLYFAWDTLNDL